MLKRLLKRSEYDALEQRYRTQYFNSIVGHKNICLIGTKDFQDRTNLAIFNSLVHIGSNPPLLGIIFRPDSVQRHTYENILSTKEYTVNLIAESDIAAAHQTAARYLREQSEFDQTGLDAEYLKGFHAPLVASSPIAIGVAFRNNIAIPLNGTNLVIGEVQWIKYPEEIVAPDGFADLTKAGIVGCIGLDAYTRGTLVQRFEYAKPDKPPRIKS
ncbi:MAG: flavin reductase [Bacteroidetes bacterium]|nr:flavin reductase [Bacteroidota bacterium]MBM3425143.1 flavin reductase [Bacteroidota bacterium]